MNANDGWFDGGLNSSVLITVVNRCLPVRAKNGIALLPCIYESTVVRTPMPYISMIYLIYYVLK